MDGNREPVTGVKNIRKKDINVEASKIAHDTSGRGTVIWSVKSAWMQ